MPTHPRPPVTTPSIPTLPRPERFELANGLPVVWTAAPTVPVLTAELFFNAGRPYEDQPLVGSLTNELITEGTRHHGAAALEEAFELLGTSLRTPSTLDTKGLTVSTVERLADRVLPLLMEVALEPALTEDSFRRVMRLRKQRLRENLGDNDTVAYRLLTEATFGAEHPYGYNGYQERYEAVKLEALRHHHRTRYVARNATLHVMARPSAELLPLLERTFGQLPVGKPAARQPLPAPTHALRKLWLPRPRQQQCMLRRGRRGIHITDPSYPALVVLDTVFGGYFGSRLMRNIREDKGYTYGIDSELDTFRFDGTFAVSADVARENVEAVRREILIEMDKLRQTEIPARELDRVRAYLTGTLATELDGPLPVASRHRAALLKGYDATDHLERIKTTIRDVSAAELLALAQDFLDPARDHEVIVGGVEKPVETSEVTSILAPV